MPLRYLPVSRPEASGLHVVRPRPMSSYSRAYSCSTRLRCSRLYCGCSITGLCRLRLSAISQAARISSAPLARAPVQRLAALDHVAHRPHRLLDRRGGIGAVAEHEVHVVELQPLERAIDGI